MIRASGDHNREVIGLAQASMEHNVVVHILGIVVTNDSYEPDLVVDHEQSGVILIDPLKRVCSDWVNTKGSLVAARRV